MVSKGQFVGLDWNRIARLHSQVTTGTHETLANESPACPEAAELVWADSNVPGNF